MNNLQFMPMTEPLAKAITTWIYPAPYDLYNMDDDEETLDELLDGSYYASINEEGELIGFICIGDAARVAGGYLAGIYGNEQVMDIGLGMRPDLTGRGQGGYFLQESLRFIYHLTHHSPIQLVVAAFNERAIKVYERAGLKKGKAFLSRGREFIVMTQIQ